MLIWKDREKLYHIDYMNKLFSVLLSECKATTLLDNQMAILCNISARAWSSCKPLCTLCIEPYQVLQQEMGTPEPLT